MRHGRARGRGAPLTKVSDLLSQLLARAGIMTAEEIGAALSGAAGPSASLDGILVEKKLVGRTTLLSLLTDHYQLPFVSLPEKVDIQVLKLLPEHMIETYQAVPLSYEEGTLTVGLAAPDNAQAIDRIAASTGFKIKPVGVLESDFKRFFAQYFEDTTMIQILKEIEVRQAEAGLPAEAGAEEPDRARPMAKLLDTILAQAARRRASDVHIEPQESFALLRLRIDGRLQTHQILPKPVLAPLASRIKVLANLDITERRLPQDGQFRCAALGREIDVRVSTIPSRYGEKIALRLLDRKAFLMNMDVLGMPAEAQSSIEQILSRPNGLFLVTGATGSGKTTTLYAMIQRLRSPHLNIITLEDPIEYELLAGSKREGGITQIQVNPKVGLTFAEGLRACLRQDPDILFVGEIRDRETAETAISAALTGHIVLSSLHTNGAVQTVARLLDMGVEPFLVVSALRGILSQRLLRVLCHNCKQAYRPPEGALQRLGLASAAAGQFYKPGGCGQCLQSGYWGRTGAFELLPLNNELNKLILRRSPPAELFAAAVAQGFRTLKQHGMDLASQGVTTIDEVLRTLPAL